MSEFSHIHTFPVLVVHLEEVKTDMRSEQEFTAFAQFLKRLKNIN